MYIFLTKKVVEKSSKGPILDRDGNRDYPIPRMGDGGKDGDDFW